MPKDSLSERVLTYLEKAKWDEMNHGMRWYDDYAVAYLTVFYAAEDKDETSVCSPHVRATYRVLGLHPGKVWPAIVERRKAKLGLYYSRFYDANGNWIPEPTVVSECPRKPVQSVRIVSLRGRRAA